MKIYLVCNATKRALSIGHRDWTGPTGCTEWAGTPEETSHFVNRCAPVMPEAKERYTTEIAHFCADNPVFVAEAQYVPEDYKMLNGYWETAYIEVPKTKRRKVQAVR
uniref:Phage protein n=1 Tax=Pseudomonas phage HRDY3 TaxID=3236930 RepID=A0AB39CDG3_9VIRU